jgi:hypothetical protein
MALFMTVFAFLWRKHVQFVQNNACHNARNLVDRSVQPPDLPSLLKLGPISPNFELRRFTKLDLFSSKTLEWGIGLLQLRSACIGNLSMYWGPLLADQRAGLAREESLGCFADDQGVWPQVVFQFSPSMVKLYTRGPPPRVALHLQDSHLFSPHGVPLS